MDHLVGIEPTYFGWKPNVFTKSLQMQKQKRPHGGDLQYQLFGITEHVNYPEIPES